MIRISNKNNKIIYPELSYLITGTCFNIHNSRGRFLREKQYSDLLEDKFKEIKLPYKREVILGDSGNIIDFIVDNKIILEIKSKRLLEKDDFYQTQRYLQATNIKLGLLINFRNRYIKPVRIIKIDTVNKNKFV